MKPREEPEIRFWRHVQKTDTCWLWTGEKNHLGYGRFVIRLNPRYRVLAHRYAYELVYGPIAPGLEPDHTCTTPACVRPSHLEPIKHALNLTRGNPSKVTRGESGFRHVRLMKPYAARGYRRPWQVRMKRDGKEITGGYFEHPEVAAAQANVMAARFYPGFRAFNQVEMG